MTEVTQEQAPQTPEQVKLALIDQLNRLYMPLINFIRSMPVNLEIGKYAFQNLDQGIMWAERAIKLLQFEVTKLPEGTDNDECKEDATQTSTEERKETT